jgi:hypothetical protein
VSTRHVQASAPAPSFSGWLVLLSVVAIGLSVAAIGFTLFRGSASPDAGCRTLAWDALPDGSGLPDGWSVAAGNFYVDGAGTSLIGPTPSDGSAPTTLYLQVTCYGADSHQALTRSHGSALATGGTDVPLVNLGDESFATEDPTNASTTVYVRLGGLLAILVAPSAIDPGELEQAARAVDTALSLAGSTAARPSPTIRTPRPSGSTGAGSPSPSVPAGPSATPTHLVPDLEKLLPATVGNLALTRQSILGTTGLVGSDPSSQALVATLDTLGKTPADFQIAAGYDESGVTDLQVFAFRLGGVKGPVLGQAIVDSYQAAGASAVTAAKVTISGKSVTHISYGTTEADDYVYVHGDVVYDVGTTDPDLAAQSLAALP